MSVKQLVAKKDKLIKKKEKIAAELSGVVSELKSIKLQIRAAIAEEKNAKIAGKEKAGM